MIMGKIVLDERGNTHRQAWTEMVGWMDGWMDR